MITIVEEITRSDENNFNQSTYLFFNRCQKVLGRLLVKFFF